MGFSRPEYWSGLPYPPPGLAEALLLVIANQYRKKDTLMGFPGGSEGKESACQYRRLKRHRFDSWVGNIP